MRDLWDSTRNTKGNRFKSVSIVVPIHNEEKILPELTRRISQVVESLPQFECEVVYVDDASSDGSSRILDFLAQQHSWLRVLFLPRNLGHQTAITTGIDYARGDAVIVIDGDLQNLPELKPDMFNRWLPVFIMALGLFFSFFRLQ